MSIKVKICGITSVEDALAAIDFGADMVGVNFYAPSPRSISLDRAREIRAAVPEAHKVVGVFVNAAREFIVDCLEQVRLDLLQFHGDEADSFARGLAGAGDSCAAAQERRGVSPCANASSIYTLLDTFHPGLYGGTGAKRPLSDLRGLDLTRVFISGGLDPDNVREAAELLPVCGRRRERRRIGARHQGPRQTQEIHSQCQVCPIVTATSANSAACMSPKR